MSTNEHPRPAEGSVARRTETFPPPRPTLEQEEERFRTEQEVARVEEYCATAIRAHERMPSELKAYLEAYVKEHVGQWRECDGKAVVQDGFYTDASRRVVLACFMVYQLDDNNEPVSGDYDLIEDEIPMPDWMTEAPPQTET